MLKIAKVKSEKEFYKKYPSEEAFMKAHGKELKKAAMGKAMVYDQLHQLTDFGNPPIAQYGGAVNPNTGMFQMPMSGKSVSQFDTMAAGYGSTPPPEGFGNVKSAGGFDAAGAAMSGLGAVQGIIGGIEAIGAQKKAKKKAEQNTQLSGLALQAQQTAQAPARKYVRPEDSLVQPGQLGNPYGSGTNFLAKNGKMIGGNPTEIQNMYNPGDMYTDLGFEPLGETLKQFKHGGMHKAEFGDYFQDSGQAQIGGAVGEAAGNALFGPIGGMVGKYAGIALGNISGGAKQARELQAEQSRGAMNSAQLAFGQNNQFGAYMEQGGKVDVGNEYKWVSHTWQPQTIAKFGEYNVKDLLKPPHDADMLRSGGHLKDEYYTPPSAEALYTGRPELEPLTMEQGGQMAMGGDLEILDGGKAETISYNPFLPDGGETVMFKGRSHDNGGIPINFGENGVEVEGGEPAVKLENGGEESNMVVFGNMKINKNIADLMGDPKAKGRKFKHYVADIAKSDAKQLKRIDKATEMINNADNNSAAGHLASLTGALMKKGAEDYQKINADLIQEAGIVQNAILDTASQLGVKSDRLAEGKLEKEKDARMIAQKGTNVPYSGTPYSDAPQLYPSPTPRELVNNIVSSALRGVNPNDEYTQIPYQPGYSADSTLPEVTVTSDKPSKVSSKMIADNEIANVKKGKFDFGALGQMALSNLAPFLRPSNANEALPADQLYPEYFAMATNQLEPVQAQTFQPMLDTPMDISLNDQLNAIDSQSRAAIRAAGQNPSAQAMIMAQSLEAKNKVLGEQTRINAANKMQTYDKNRALLNDAQLRNLQILDQQYVRQAQARSNTKEQTFNALSSIAAKTAQQRAANRKLAVMENMYGFRFTPSGRAINVNAPAQFNMSGNPFARNTGRGLAPGYGYTYDEQGQIIGTRKVGKSQQASMDELDSAFGKNGTKVSKKNARNSSIVKALKNL